MRASPWAPIALAILLGACSSGAASTAPTGTSVVVPPATSTNPPSTTTTVPVTSEAPTSTTPPTTTSTTPATTTPATTIVASADLKLTVVGKIGGSITPKSVAASPTGLILAQNMMYRHSITVYDRSGALLHTIADSVDLHAFGFAKYSAGQTYKGAPVEAAFTPDGSHAYVTNYWMSGPGFTHPGSDICAPRPDLDTSFVYRIDLVTFRVDQVIAVGSVPKFVAVSPDGRWVLVANWCSYDLSIIDTTSGTEIKRLHLGPYPRGIAIDAASTTAYVAVMGTRDVATIKLADDTLGWIRNVGQDPRHVVLSPDGAFLYVTNNGENTVAKVDLATGKVIARVGTGTAPRSMTIAPDGTAIYVVNYFSNTMAKVRTSDMTVLQVVATPVKPIGITYEPVTRTVWVACYSGVIVLLREG